MAMSTSHQGIDSTKARCSPLIKTLRKPHIARRPTASHESSRDSKLDDQPKARVLNEPKSPAGILLMNDELSGDGMIILDAESIATVYYWLTAVPEPS
jgi:hypothetical protein